MHSQNKNWFYSWRLALKSKCISKPIWIICNLTKLDFAFQSGFTRIITFEFDIWFYGINQTSGTFFPTCIRQINQLLTDLNITFCKNNFINMLARSRKGFDPKLLNTGELKSGFGKPSHPNTPLYYMEIVLTNNKSALVCNQNCAKFWTSLGGEEHKEDILLKANPW